MQQSINVYSHDRLKLEVDSQLTKYTQRIKKILYNDQLKAILSLLLIDLKKESFSTEKLEELKQLSQSEYFNFYEHQLNWYLKYKTFHFSISLKQFKIEKHSDKRVQMIRYK